MEEFPVRTKNWLALRVTLIYLIIGGTWILISDNIVASAKVDVADINKLQLLKGFLYIFITGAGLFLFIRRYLGRLLKSKMQLQVREQLFQIFQKASSEGFVVFNTIRNKEGNVIDYEALYCNQEAANLMKLEVEQVLGRLLSENFPCLPEHELRAHFFKVAETGSPEYFELVCDDTGELRWFRYAVVKYEDGVALCFCDITEQKRMEEQLRQERSFSKSIVNNARTIIVIWALDGSVTLFNSFAEELTGYAADEIIGVKWPRLLGCEGNRAQMQELFERLRRGQSSNNLENQWLCKDGRKVDILWTNTPAYDSDGKVIAVISMGVDITDRKKAEVMINHMAYHDPLTDLPNRALFNDRLDLALANARRDGRKLAVMYMDLDRFKLVNDSMGHAMGDQVLIDVAKRVKGCLRQGDTVARVGGDEFILIFPTVRKNQDASKIALKIIKALKEPFEVGGQEFHLTTSIGIALYPNDGEDAETLVKNADSALYSAKEEGNTFRHYNPQMNESVRERLDIERDLCRALEQGEFIIHYQPQVNIDSGTITGMEALLRWKHPERGLVFPGEFINIAEETGLILEIGKWVLQKACAQNKAWQDAGYPCLRVVVNLSARQFMHHNLVEIVAKVLRDTGLSPRWLELEITEGVIMKDIDYTKGIIKRLKKMGVQIAIDDFGTGYSSLNYLKLFPLDTLKIDKSFVQGILSSPEDAAIVATVIVLTQNLKLKSIAEGVETEEQLEFLRERRCCEMQGFYFSKPVPAEEFEVFLKEMQHQIEVTSTSEAAT